MLCIVFAMRLTSGRLWIKLRAYALGVKLHHPLQWLYLRWLRLRKVPVRFSIGDSHAAFTFRGIPRTVRIALGPVTMHRIGRDGLQRFLLFGGAPVMWPRSLVQPGDELFFSFGEIDCRSHVLRQVALGRSETEVITTLARSYIEAVEKERIAGVNSCIVSVTPPADAARLRHFTSFAPIGSDSDRVRITRALNVQLKTLAAEHGCSYLDVYGAYADADGMLPLRSSDGLTHVGDTSAVARLLSV